jgi:NADPH:quinone reductase-like Zn-dependent oxidoreductase
MKAIIYSHDGSPEVFKYSEIEKPTPGDHELLIKVRAASVNPLDWRLKKVLRFVVRVQARLGKPKPTVPGVDVAGQVEAVGRNVTQFKPGDEVFGVCRGAFAEYGRTTEDKLAPKPANISFEDAAALPVAALTALQGLRDKGRIQPGQRIVVDGASGGVGTFAVQLAKWFGAEVTAVCSTPKMETARSLGADHVIDYTQEDFTRSGRRYDLIFAANAYHSIFDYRRALAADGIYVMAGGGWTQIFQVLLVAPLLSRMGSKKLRFFVANINRKDLVLLMSLLEAGKVVPVIDRRYPLSEVPEAVRYLEQWHARGKVIITL